MLALSPPPRKGTYRKPEKAFARANHLADPQEHLICGAGKEDSRTISSMPLRILAKRLKRFAPLLTAPAALLLLQGQALAITTLVTFPLNDNTDGNSGFNYSIFDSSVLSASTIANGPGFGAFSVGTDGLTPDVQVLKTGPSLNLSSVTAADALNNNWYFTIALTPNSSMSIDTINLDWSRGGTTGVRGWFVRSSLDNFVSDLYSNQTPDGTAKGLQPASISLSGFTGLTTPTNFRFYSYTERQGRFMDFSNISFVGSGPASVPGPLPILGVAAAFGFSRKLRKRIKLHRGNSDITTSPGA